MLTKAQYFSIEDFPNYIFYTDGDIYSVRKCRWLKPQRNHKGYCWVTLYGKRGIKRFHIARLIATIFIRNPKKGEQINHKNGIKDDNRVGNLEWVTYKENMLHANSNGLIKKFQKNVTLLDTITGKIHRFSSQEKASLFLGVKPYRISYCKLKNQKVLRRYKIIKCKNSKTKCERRYNNVG